MYTMTAPQAPSGHTTRPQTYAIGHKVNPFLNASPFRSCETWLLPNARTLHMPRYQGDPLGDARNDGQVPKYKDEGARREEPEKGYRTRTSGPGPDIRPLPQAWTSGTSPKIRRPSQKTPEAEPSQPGHPARREPPDIRPSSRKSGAPSQKLDPASPDIRPQRPDIRRLGKARTSGPLCLRAAHLG